MTVYIDGDRHAKKMSSYLSNELSKEGYDVVYINSIHPYPDMVKNAVMMIDKSKDKLILCCSTGIGCQIVANRFDGIFASACNDIIYCHYFRQNNNGNVLCLGSDVISIKLGLQICRTFLTTEFDNNNQNRIELINNISKKIQYGNN